MYVNVFEALSLLMTYIYVLQQSVDIIELYTGRVEREGLKVCEPDNFKFEINMNQNIKSKKKMLSSISRVFDPLGPLNPVTQKFKRVKPFSR